MTSRLCMAALVLPVALTLRAQDDTLTHAQKVESARKLLSTAVMLSEFGRPIGPEPFAHMSDEQVRQEIANCVAKYHALSRPEHEANLALEEYSKQLVRQGKTTPFDLSRVESKSPNSLRESAARQIDPTGRLAALITDKYAKVMARCDNHGKMCNLYAEIEIRTNPDNIIRTVYEFEAVASQQTGKAIQELSERYKRGDPDVVAMVRGTPGGSTKAAPKATTATKLQIQIPGVAAPVNLNYSDLYGANADPRMIEAVEAKAISRLPTQLRQGVPRDVQLVFVYGGYERLPAEVKQRLQASVESLRASAASSGRSLEQEFARVYSKSTNIKGPPPWLSVSTKSTAKLGGYQLVAMILTAISQSWTDAEYDRRRQKKWADAFRRVAAEIPSGQHETVTFFEEMRIHEYEVIGFRETLSVNGYRSKDGTPCPAEAPKPLVNRVSGRSAPHPYNFFQTAKAVVVGTGNATSVIPSEQEAFRAGCEMGVTAAAATLDRNVMAATYAKYNKDPKTREAYKLGYRKGSDWKNLGSPCK